MKSFQRGLVRLDPGPGCYKLDCPSRVLRVYYIENAPVARGENGSDLLHDALPPFLQRLSGEIRASSYPPSDRPVPNLGYLRAAIQRYPQARY